MASPFGQGSGPIYLNNIGCTGSEERLTSCPHPNSVGETGCRHNEDAGVRCSVEGQKLELVSKLGSSLVAQQLAYGAN